MNKIGKIIWFVIDKKNNDGNRIYIRTIEHIEYSIRLYYIYA